MAWFEPPVRGKIREVSVDKWYYEVASAHHEVIHSQRVFRSEAEALAYAGLDPHVPHGTDFLVWSSKTSPTKQ